MEHDRGATMRYMLLIQQGTGVVPGRGEWETLPEEEKRAVFAEYEAIGRDPRVTGGMRLQPPDTATTVRVQDGRTLTTDGPFVELKEAIGGWMLLDAGDLDEAIEVAGRIPAARMGGAVEIRPVVE
ncbi:YciI family protein [Conexibacter stalactiti]|uniref:YciI family protein n=1 Tax=Conexibacter stalactiti TaxID=1940611 RepID=A0ABU4HNM9_9ACTN|nr:YciI family protein [Conexibacter stalactiti]MDW5594882.1 YciI family protein [Conexibacter stalactiti]MEC5035524.1 YciI family protein [Conexibacter stalactiti]